MLTLGITFLLVVAVIYVFLQGWRATPIPTLAIPVSIIGVFAALVVLDYSANNHHAVRADPCHRPSYRASESRRA